MEAYDATLEELFWRGVCYVIPAFQRPYVWKEVEQWQPLWNDILGMAEETYLNDASIQSKMPARAARRFRPPEHFLGAIVTQQQPSLGVNIEPRQVIDGQQRLTTLSLLLGAMQEVFKNFNLPHAQEISRFVMNDMQFADQDPAHAFKVWPTVLNDQNTFRRAMHNVLPTDEEKTSQIIRAHEFFKRQVTDWIGGDSETHNQRAEALQKVVTKSLKIVVIEIDMADNPHVIFETLNARGTPLLQADLIKNFILEMEPRSNKHDAGAANHLAKLEEKWWRKEVKQGRLGDRPRVEIFLNYWMIMRQAGEVQSRRVYSTFCEYAKGKEITGVAEDIGRLAEIYRKIQDTGDDSVLGRFLYRWNIMKMGVFTPVLMWLLSAEIPKESLERCLRIIESYLVRRMVCRASSAGYNRMLLELLQQLDASHRSTVMPDEVLKAFLINQKDANTFWPTDDDLRETFLTKRLYRGGFAQEKLRLVLEGIEEGLRRSPQTDDKRVPLGLTIEHVMPQAWDQHWDPPTETDIPGEATEQRNKTIHTIGNLTLLTQSLNVGLSNASWLDRRDGKDGMDGLRKSTLQLNSYLVNAGDVWNEEMIAERALRLAEVAAEVWPYADRI